MIDDETLLPCPFCGNKKLLLCTCEYRKSLWKISCNVCHTEMHSVVEKNSKEHLIERWNRRAEMADKKYIDAEILLDEINGYENTRADNLMSEWYSDMVKRQPAADVAEVVRCKDCRYLHTNDYSIKCELHAPYCYEVNENEFCSKGARMDGDE